MYVALGVMLMLVTVSQLIDLVHCSFPVLCVGSWREPNPVTAPSDGAEPHLARSRPLVVIGLHSTGRTDGELGS